MGLNSLTFGTVNTSDYGVFISGGGTFGGAQRDFSMVDIAGRNGSLIIENNRFHNVTIGYPAFIIKNINSNLPALRAALASLKGYQRLSDTYHPNEFRLGTYSSALTPNMGPLNRYGSFELAFNCKPQRFLTSGETAITNISGTRTINNPTLFDAKPLLVVRGTSGRVAINGTYIDFTGISTSITVDCELQDAYKDGQNQNSKIYAPVFPVLKAGNNTVVVSGSITSIDIVPRWWTI